MSSAFWKYPPFFQVSIFCNGEPVFFEFAGSQMEPFPRPLKAFLIREPQGDLGGVDLCGPLDSIPRSGAGLWI